MISIYCAGLNVHDGAVTYQAVAQDLNLAFKPSAAVLRQAS